MSRAGLAPIDLGHIDLSPREMLFWMYCPISVPQMMSYHLPANLGHFAEIVSTVKQRHLGRFTESYVYLTAKTLWVDDGYIGNRPGWHIDGYGTTDLNFIWSDRAPTEFVTGDYHLSDECDDSLNEMDAIGWLAAVTGTIKTYPDKHLLQLDNTVIHRSPEQFEAGMRTFVKVSLSDDRYDLKGNSINHILPETHWPLVERQRVRNHPATRNADHG